VNLFNCLRIVLLTTRNPVVLHRQTDTYLGCLGGAAVQHRTRDRKVAGSTPGRGANKSTRSTQPSIPPG